MTIDERLEALTKRFRELEKQRLAAPEPQAETRRQEAESEARGADLDARIDKLLTLVRIDSENIRALARIAESKG